MSTIQANYVLDSSGGNTAKINGVTPSFATLAGAGNLLINGTGRQNQRAYASGTATTTANQFTLDRWFVVTSGQNLVFTGTAAGYTMTAPAGGVSQVIEGANIVGGTYCLSWTGTATATVNGASVLNGGTVTLTAGSNATVKFSSGTFTQAQLEYGSVQTPYQWVDVATELKVCERYYQESPAQFYASAVSSNFRVGPTWRTVMRATPTLTLASGTVPDTITRFGWSKAIDNSNSITISSASAELTA
jgi:hypothetical protein